MMSRVIYRSSSGVAGLLLMLVAPAATLSLLPVFPTLPVADDEFSLLCRSATCTCGAPITKPTRSAFLEAQIG